MALPSSSSSRARSYAGAKAIEDGLFQRFPAEQVFALHNWPGLPPGRIGITPGPAMAAADRIDQDRRQGRTRASARGDRSRAGRGAHHHRAIDRVANVTRSTPPW
jgi:hippurate hydrolase